ncbi:MAG: hypothetical protein ABGW69_00575, partial [Nanoarchaeota archaeon]
MVKLKTNKKEFFKQLTSQLTRYTNKEFNKAKPLNTSKRAAVPEYIWYISLIIIAITLVVGIVNITKKSNKNITPPTNLQASFDIKVTPQKQLVVSDLSFIGDFDINKDSYYLYLCCNNKCLPLSSIFDPKTFWFTRTTTGSITLKTPVVIKNSSSLITYYGS